MYLLCTPTCRKQISNWTTIMIALMYMVLLTEEKPNKQQPFIYRITDKSQYVKYLFTNSNEPLTPFWKTHLHRIVLIIGE